MHITYPDSPLPAVCLDCANSSQLRGVAQLCRDSGIALRLHYDTARFRYPIAASFTSRGPAAARF